ncbi:hypothetical protein AsAng_0056190 [Aureispira anguillae]|uniref:Uncharacterized protein n=1 Tax=Aureispira anguillae TaxID=2864201 RepID=A0A915YKE1_9BACT|nr:hypothetical protein AsAng_0056190 [Aureispira anguillae]
MTNRVVNSKKGQAFNYFLASLLGIPVGTPYQTARALRLCGLEESNRS